MPTKTTLPKGKDKQEREYEEKLPVPLTDSEKVQAGERLARTLAAIKVDEEKRKDINADIKAKKKELDSLEKMLTSGVEQRHVKCREVMDWPRKSVTVTRMDTSEVITERPMRQDELQIKMRLDEAAQKKAAKGKGEKDAPPSPPAKPEVK
jgi:hypothetical protein